jgi:5-formyltetrahydrofolate cyclo-ligase
MLQKNKKQSLRSEMLKKRAMLSLEYVKETETKSVPVIMSFLSRMAATGIDKCRQLTVMSYMSYKNEFPTHILNSEIISAGFRLVLPYTDSNFNIIPCVTESLDDLTTSDMGIYEPSPEKSIHADISEIDIIIMPGVVFDCYGNRIGFGKGCYDRFIANMPYTPLTVGAAYDFQVLADIPYEENDVPCSMIITENRIIRTHFSSYR